MEKKIKVGSKKGTIVCLHGNSSSSIVFHPLFKSKLLDYSIISFDLPGHGDSIEKYKNHSNFSISFFKENLIKCINSIDDDILLVGNSLGGHLAIEISEEIKRLKGLLIFGSPPVKKPINFEEAFLPVAALQTYLTEKPTEEAINEAVNVAVKNKEIVLPLISDFKKTNTLVRKNIADDILGNNLSDEYKIFTTLKIPKFIIAGHQDPSVNRDYLKLVSKECINSCEFIEFENCGHYPSIEKPNLFIEKLIFITSKVF